MPSVSFQIPLWAELTAVGLGALQGALFASGLRDRRIDLLGVVLIGIGVALGGSVLRDILLNERPVVMQSNWYLPVAAVAALGGMALQRLFSRLGPLIVTFDAVSIGLFGAIGTAKALDLSVPAVPAVFVGALSAVGGSVVRDVSLNRPVELMQVGSLYAVAAGVGSTLLVVLVAAGVAIPLAAIAGVVLTTVVRLGAVGFGWSVPEQRALPLRRPTAR
jgi:uncharacterized membrane protein YeiH